MPFFPMLLRKRLSDLRRILGSSAASATAPPDSSRFCFRSRCRTLVLRSCRQKSCIAPPDRSLRDRMSVVMVLLPSMIMPSSRSPESRIHLPDKSSSVNNSRYVAASAWLCSPFGFFRMSLSSYMARTSFGMSGSRSYRFCRRARRTSSMPPAPLRLSYSSIVAVWPLPLPVSPGIGSTLRFFGLAAKPMSATMPTSSPTTVGPSGFLLAPTPGPMPDGRVGASLFPGPTSIGASLTDDPRRPLPPTSLLRRFFTTPEKRRLGLSSSSAPAGPP
mmetsp:Transcript_3778/g.13987  ORF Transcript_3778/g.13987 Transcript_3778/m.13987 type:complete len:274 (-) Transcript_3778:337-1158(-)